jgi:hypothetical protein
LLTVPAKAAGAIAEVFSAAAAGDEPAGGELTWQTSSLEIASMLRMCRASGSSVRTEISGSTVRGANGHSRSVAARRINRRRPSGKATAT